MATIIEKGSAGHTWQWLVSDPLQLIAGDMHGAVPQRQWGTSLRF